MHNTDEIPITFFVSASGSGNNGIPSVTRREINDASCNSDLSTPVIGQGSLITAVMTYDTSLFAFTATGWTTESR
jgi:hypothetical protein